MIKDKLRELFKEYDPGLQRIIHEVLIWEQENISKLQPQYKDKIKEIISLEAKRQVDQEEKGGDR